MPNSTGVDQTLFRMPNVPDDFGVSLTPANLRRIKFSALDFTMARRAAIEYIKTYFPDDFNDFVASNGIIMIVEVLAAFVGKLSLRGDVLVNECFMPTCTTEEALVNHLALIGQRIQRQTPAVVDVRVTLDNPVSTNVEISAGSKLTANGPDGLPIVYEIYRAPGDFYSNVVIPAGKRGVIAYGIEGQFISPTAFVSGGGPNQTVIVVDDNMLEAPIVVEVTTGDAVENWSSTTEPIEKYGPNDKICEVTFLGSKVTFRFGDDVYGKALLSGQSVSISYRAGGGVRGRIGAGQLSDVKQITPLPPANAPATVTFINVTPSVGGTDKETLTHAKRRAPADFAMHNSIVTAGDYAQAANSFSHPVFGSVAKAVASVRSSLNANLVEVYVLAVGGNGRLVTPSVGLKKALTTYFDDINVLTDHVSILDGVVYPIDVDVTIVVNRSADASVVKNKVEGAITNFFDASNWEMGQALYISNLLEVIQSIDGISHVDMRQPADNVLPRDSSLDSSLGGIVFNGLIVEGAKQIRYYYERGRYRG